MSPDAKRAGRITELTMLVGSCASRGITKPEDIIAVVRKRAYEMAPKQTAESYIQEMIWRFSRTGIFGSL